MLDFSASPFMYVLRGTCYSVANQALQEPVMSTTDALFTFLFGVGLPSWDVYSDLGLIYNLMSTTISQSFVKIGSKTLLTGNVRRESHPKFAIAMFCPILLKTVFMIPQWWNIERKTTMKNKIWTFFLVLIQFWPQWKMVQVIYIGLIKKDPEWIKKKEYLQRNVGNLGKNLESFFG